MDDDNGWVQLPEPEMPPGFADVVNPEDLLPPEEPPGNVDDNGTAHFCVITPHDGEPDMCGGCREEWPCRSAPKLLVITEAPTEAERTMALHRNLR